MKSLARILLSGVKFAIIGYLLLIGLLFVVQRSLLYPAPQGEVLPGMAGLPQMQIETVLTEDGLPLTSWFVAPSQPMSPVAIVFHGNGARLSMYADLARRLEGMGFGVLLAGYRGYEGNPGSPTEEGLYSDARAHIAWLSQQGYKNFILVGHSLGTGVAVQMAVEFPQAKALVLEAPYTSMIDAASAHYPYVPVRWLLKDRYDSLAKIPQVQVPLMVVHGLQDPVISADQGKRLFAAAREPKSAAWVDGANHVDFYDKGGWPAVAAFLKQHCLQDQP